MPSLPKWINDTVENVWSSKFKDCTVTEIKKSLIIFAAYVLPQICRMFILNRLMPLE